MPIAVEDVGDYEWNEDQPQERELIRRGPELAPHSDAPQRWLATLWLLTNSSVPRLGSSALVRLRNHVSRNYCSPLIVNVLRPAWQPRHRLRPLPVQPVITSRRDAGDRVSSRGQIRFRSGNCCPFRNHAMAHSTRRPLTGYRRPRYWQEGAGTSNDRAAGRDGSLSLSQATRLSHSREELPHTPQSRRDRFDRLGPRRALLR